MTRTQLAELKLPARPDVVPTAKRVAASMGSLVGLDLEGIDELNIGVTQTCENVIAQAREAWVEEATLKLVFWSTDRGIQVDVEVIPPRTATAIAAPATPPSPTEAYEWLTDELIRCFVDDFRSHVDRHRGRVRFQLTKYLIEHRAGG